MPELGTANSRKPGPAGTNDGHGRIEPRVASISDDDLYNYENGSTTVQLTARVGQQTLGSPVQLTVRDNEPRPSITLAASSDRVFEGESFTITATAEPRYAGTLSVDLSVTDSQGVLTGTIPSSLELDAGAATAGATISTENDGAEKLNARVVFTLANPSPPGRLGNPRSAALDWLDDDGPPVIGTPRDGLKGSRYNIAPDQVYPRPAHGLRVSWSAVTHGAEYQLEYRKTGDTGAWTRTTIGDFDQSPSITSNRTLMGVAANLECNTEYDLRLSVRGQRPQHADGFGPYATLNGRSTGPCAIPDQITNLVVTIEPDCLTLSWTRPSDAGWTGFRVTRLVLPSGGGRVEEVIHEQVNDRATRFRDCVNQHGNRYGQEGHGYAYFIEYLKPGAGSQVQTGTLVFTELQHYKPYGELFSPRNLRLTTDTQFRRTMRWEAPPSQWLTAHRAFRGELTSGNVTDPWTNGYLVERREYTVYPNGEFSGFAEGSSWETMRQGQNGNTGTSYTDNENRGAKLYVYRVRTTNAEGASSEYTDDYLWDAPVVFTDPGDTGQGGAQQTGENTPATGAPTISGTAQVGETLTASTSGIDDADGIENATFAHQWLSNDGNDDADIGGATESIYTLDTADEGKTINVRVTFTDDVGNEESLTSAATTAVTAQPNSPATGVPTLSGTAQVNETLTADTSGIADEDGMTNAAFSYQWLAGGSDMDGATGASYTLTSGEEGDTIQVKVSFTDDEGNEESLTSVATAAVAARPPPLTVSLDNSPDSHNGTGAFSFELEFSEDVNLGFQRLRDHAFQVTGGTVAEARRLEPGSNLGWRITVRPTDDGDVKVVLPVTTDCNDQGAVCTHDGGKLSAEVSLIVTGPTEEQEEDTGQTNSPATGAPTISGTAQVGETLTASTSGIADGNGLDNATYSYQWIRTDSDISGATGSTHTLAGADQGEAIKVRVSFTDDDGNEESLTSAATVAVAAKANTPATGAPTISGEAQVGETLTASTSGIADADGLDNATYSYQWIRSDSGTDTDISNATGSTYTLVDADRGKTVKVRVSFTDDEGNEESLTSGATAAVAARPNNPATGAPTISGTAQVGETLTASTQGIADEDGLDNATFSHQWVADTQDIAGATGSTYTLVAGDEGKTVRVRVSFTDDEGNAESLTSTATAQVAGLPPEPLTASLESTPSTHDGSTTFTFGLRFSEELDLSYKTLRDHAFEVTGGTVTKARRVTQGSNLRWEIHVTPNSNADVTVVLPATTDCDDTGAVCTADGRMLSSRLELTVSGTGS